MASLCKVFFWGLVISFLGTIPLSPLNLTAMQISLKEGAETAMLFSLGTIVSELIYLRVGVAGLNWLRGQRKMFEWTEWITLILITALAAGSFYAAYNGSKSQESVILSNPINRFLLGMIMSVLTVMHIPFWFGWSTVLFTRKILRPSSLFYNIYTLAAGIGTFVANCLFIYGGSFIIKKISTSEQTVNLILAWVFVVTALAQLLKMIFRKPVAETPADS